MTASYYKGRNFGFNAAREYATGTRQSRREIRRVFARTAHSMNQFWQGAREGWQDCAEQRAEHIEAGRAARTVKPTRLLSFLNHLEQVA